MKLKLYIKLKSHLTFKKALSTTFACLISIYSADIVSQDRTTEENYDNWYQIEVIIFSDQSNRFNDEAWPKNLALAYPPNIRHLINPDVRPAVSSTTEQLADSFETSTEGVIETPATAPTGPSPYTLLPDEQLSLKAERNKIKRLQGRKILFHNAWIQPLKTQEKSESIIIEGGNQYGSHSELEGTLTFSLSRYLHIHTDLWFTTFEPNYGQAGLHWPDLPEKPKNLHLEINTQLSEDQRPVGQSNPEILNTDFVLTEQQKGSDLFAISSLGNTEIKDVTARPYLITQIIGMKQKRRMRSNELHYIDHPHAGILLRIQPYEFAEPQTTD